MFENSPLEAALPASDIERAVSWYSDALGLEPAEVVEGEGVRYETGGTRFFVYPSAYAGTNQATVAAFVVADFDAAMERLRGAGVTFEEFEYGEQRTVDGVMTQPSGARGAWFKDSEGNILALSSE